MRRRHRPHSSPAKRRFEWGRAFGSGELAANVPAGTVLYKAFWVKVPAGVENTSTPGNDLEPEDWTLTRTLVQIGMSAQANTTGFVFGFFSAGLIRWQGIDDTPPIPTQIPFPVCDGDADWIWTWTAPDALLLGGTDLIEKGNDGQDTYTKSSPQRKLSSRDGLLFVVGFDNSDPSSNTIDGLAFAANFRFGFKLP